MISLAEDCSARDVSEFLLARSSDAMMSGNFDMMRQCFEIPQEIQTFDGTKLINSVEELEATFRAIRAYHRRAGITEMVRHCLEAVFKGPDEVEATHVSRLLAGNVLVNGPHSVFSVLRRREGIWRIASSKYAIADSDELNRALTLPQA